MNLGRPGAHRVGTDTRPTGEWQTAMAFPSSDDITVPSTDEELKAACRLGLHPALRRSLWRRLVKAEPRADFYSAACVRVFGSAQPKPSRLFRVSGACPVCCPCTLGQFRAACWQAPA